MITNKSIDEAMKEYIKKHPNPSKMDYRVIGDMFVKTKIQNFKNKLKKIKEFLQIAIFIFGDNGGFP